jgi:polysaccharide pyruvyl transferase WcaK-like protein
MLKKIFISGYYGYGNIGDNILLDVIVSQIRDIFPNAEIMIMSNDDTLLEDSSLITTKFNTQAKSKLLYFFHLVKFLINIYSKNDIIIFGGGTQIFDNSKNSWKGILVDATVLMINQIFFGKKVIHYGVGIGTVNTKLGKLFTYIVGLFSDYFIIRDIESYEKLTALKINPNKVMLSRDLAYSLNFTNISSTINHKKLNLGFSLFEYYKYTEINIEKDQKLTTSIIETLEYILKKTKHDIYIFPFQVKYGNQDEKFAKHIKDTIISNRIHIVDYSNKWTDITNVMSKMDICIGMRYHFLLLALKMKKPVIALKYASKVQSELEMYGLNDYIIDLSDISKEKILLKLSKILGDYTIKSLIEEELNQIEKKMILSEKKFKVLLNE